MFQNIIADTLQIPPSYSAYDDVVDKSSFRPDSEQVRALKFNPQGSGSVPCYDYPDGKIPDDDPVSPTIVALRSGKLDKADVAKIQKSIYDEAKTTKDTEKYKKVSEALDKALGISDNSENS